MKINTFSPIVQNDLKSAASFITKNTNLTAKMNSQNQIEIKTDKGVTIRRLDGANVGKRMNQNKINTYV